jgi:transposase
MVKARPLARWLILWHKGGMRKEGSPEVLEERRRIAGRLFEQDFEPQDIAHIVNVHPQTVREWRRQYEAGGIEALAAKPHPGPECKLTVEQKQQLLTRVAQPPTHYGYGVHLWTTQLIARLIKEQFGVTYHHDHVGVIMHQLGYSYQKPVKRAKERDEAKIEQWRTVEWPAIERAGKELQSTLVFVDEAGFSMIPSIKKQWAPRGQTPVVEHRNRWHRKVSVIGGLTVSADRSQLGLYVDWHPDEHVDQEKVVLFLEHLVQQVNGPLTIIWDNLAAHGGKLVRAFVERHPQVRLHRLPPYAPDLNPIEMVWSLTKYHRMANHGITELDELHQRAAATVANVGSQHALLRSCIAHARLDDALWPASAQ